MSSPTPNTQHYLVYNGIELQLSKFQAWDSESIWSEDGSTRLYTHHYISIRGWINPTMNGYSYTSNASALTHYRKNLLEPRKGLTIVVNGNVSLNIPATNPFASGRFRSPGDAKNGPLPKTVRVMEWEGASLLVEFSVECWDYPCETLPGSNPSVEDSIIYSRWSQTEEIDTNGYSTITSTGQIKVRTDVTPVADDARGLPFPIKYILPGYVRDSQKYNVSSDGSTLDWEIKDRQVYVPPASILANGESESDRQKITEWNATWTEESGLDQGSFVIFGTLSIWLKAPPQTDKSHMILFCGKVANSRLRLTDTIQSYTFEEGLSDNTLSFTMRVIIYRPKKTNNDAVIPIPLSAENNNSSLTRIGLPIDFGTSGSSYPSVGYQTINYKPPAIRGETGRTWIIPEANRVPGVANGPFARTLLIIKQITDTCSDSENKVMWSQALNQEPINLFVDPNYRTKQALLTKETEIVEFNNPYMAYEIGEQIIESSNKIQLSRADGNTSASCFYATPTTPLSKKVVRFRISRLNQVPDLPAPSLSDQTILKKTITMLDPQILPSGVDRIYTITGEYIFGMDKTAQIGTNTLAMPASINDTQNVSSSNKRISANNFVPNLIS